MLEKPDLSDEQIIDCLQENYHLRLTNIEFLPIGYDVSASAYRVETKSETYFLKVKQGNISKASLVIPFIMNGIGLSEIVAPMQNQARQTTTMLDDFNLILYPFIEGRTGMDIGLSDNQWRKFGSILNRVHTTDLPGGLRKYLLHKENFIPPYAETVRKFDIHITASRFDNPHEKALANFWLEKRDEILKILARTEALGSILKNDTTLNFVLCHSDIHTANILVDADGGLHIVDWDGIQLAPKERDLMFITEKSEHEQQLLFEGYGEVDINRIAIAYYRYEWVVQEFGDYGEQVIFMDNIQHETKANAVDEFKQLFSEGDVVEAAYQSDSAIK